MDPDREDRMRALEDAIERYLERDETVPDAEMLAANPGLADLLGPMLRAGDPAPHDDEDPVRLGDLDLVREIGRGGMGVVWEAHDRVLKRRVAVKVLARGPETPATAIVRFRREAELAASLRHPAIVPVHALGESDEAFHLVMELEHAASLAAVLARLRNRPSEARAPGAFAAAAAAAMAERFPAPAVRGAAADREAPVRAAVAIVAQVAAGLAHAHTAGVLHRDVKPANVLVDATGRAWLTDFGLACMAGDPAVTQAGSAPGTPHYMAPEQTRGERAALSPACDVFALGATLYEALTLRRAFGGDTVPAVMHAVLHQDPPLRGPGVPPLPGDLIAVLEKALEKDPARRYPSGREFAADLQAFLAGEPVSARPVTGVARALRRARREPWRAAAMVLLVVGLPVVGGLAWHSWRTSANAAAGERLLAERWIDTQLATGFREAGEGDTAAAQACFVALLQRQPASEEGTAGLSVAARKTSDRAALAALRAQPQALALSPALQRRERALQRALGEAIAEVAADREDPVGFDAFLQGYWHLERGHAGQADAFGEARRLLNRAIVTSDHPRPLYYFEWLHAAAHARDPEAVGAARDAIRRLWPADATGCFWDAFAAAEVGDLDGAILALDRALARDPHFGMAALNRVRMLRMRGDVAGAVRALQAIAPADASPIELAREFGATLYAQKDYAGAAGHLRRALAARPGDPQVRHALATALLASGNAQEAKDLLLPVARARPTDVVAQLDLATAWTQLQNLPEARRSLEACAALRPEAATLYALGCTCGELGDTAAAQTAYERAIAVDTRHVRAHVNLANLQLRAGARDEAERHLRAALAVDPAFEPARRSLLRTLDQRPADAVAMCREWAAVAPDLAEAWRHLAWSLLQTHDATANAEALGHARKAAAMTLGVDPPTQHVLGCAQLANGDPQTARRTVQEALTALDPKDRFTPYYQGLMQATLQQCDAALKEQGR